MTPLPRIDVESATREQLISHIDELEFRLGELMPSEDAVLNLQLACGLPRQCALLLAALSTGRVGTREALCRAIARWSDDIGTGSVNVVVFKARMALRPFGIGISNVWGVGYVMDAESAARVRAIMKGDPV